MELWVARAASPIREIIKRILRKDVLRLGLRSQFSMDQSSVNDNLNEIRKKTKNQVD